jgi:hypothetical protein
VEGGGDKIGQETTRAAGTVDNGCDDERDSRPKRRRGAVGKVLM